MEALLKLTTDLRTAAKTLNDAEARFLVDAYYQMQKDRIRSGNRMRSLNESGEPHEVLNWLASNSEMLEGSIKTVLGIYAKNHPVGGWLLDQKGIGPVIAAGLLAYIDITKANTAGKIWSFAGIDVGSLDKSKQWKESKDKKRPYCLGLKTLCWKISESFVKVSGKEDALYGQLYKQKKEFYTTKNNEGGFKELAARYLSEKNYSKTTEAYKAYTQGKLPDAHIHAMAKRYAVKLFLSHLHHVWYVQHYGVEPPKPFVIEHMGHVDWIKPNITHSSNSSYVKVSVPKKEPLSEKVSSQQSEPPQPKASGTGDMGITKHRKSGHSGKSPKFRANQEIELQKEQEKKIKRPKNPMYGSVKEALDKNKS